MISINRKKSVTTIITYIVGADQKKTYTVGGKNKL